MMITDNLIRRKISEIEPHLRDILISILEGIEKHTQHISQQVTKNEFNELKDIVAGLTRKVNELAEAHRRTEEDLRNHLKEQIYKLEGSQETWHIR